MSSNSKIPSLKAINELVIKFANVNGTGSASANNMFAKAIFRMGIPVTPKNIFPSNIQGLPTWYEVRISEKGYQGRRDGIDLMVAVNPQSMAKDVQAVRPGGYFFYDSTRPLDIRYVRDDIHYIGVPLTDICRQEYTDPRQRQLFKNVIYIGALAALLNIEFTVLSDLVGDQFKGKQKLIAPNIHALELGYQYANKHFSCPLDIRVERRDLVQDQILTTGNNATGLGAVYAGATVAAWYPITPSTSVVEAFDKYASRLRIDAGTGQKNYAIVQAEDELSAIGMVIGAAWNGARSFTATSGPGISLMSEFLGLAYFAEVPAVLINVQRAGPSTGMPTRTQQPDVLSCAYASHGDTKQVLLFPSTPKECFDLTAQAFDLTERLQTPVILMSDLDLGMNDHMCEPFTWDDAREYDRGKVLNAEQLDALTEKGERFGRYNDVDSDGICYRTYPGTHPTKGAFFTRGTSRDPYAVYSEDGDVYVDNVDRLNRKFNTAKQILPKPMLVLAKNANKKSDIGLIYYGTSDASANEALDNLAAKGVFIDGMRLLAFPFHQTVEQFINDHEQVFVIDQNRDGQMRTLLVNELDALPSKLIKLLSYDGMPITAMNICRQIEQRLFTENTSKKAANSASSSKGGK
ncbi:2-oxoacid:acceptor oxidoreductase subunit alpha [Thalassotalea sp. M1531]|uniref:2-oxoacid:acceptor oxidoreductase subunit alpha n=1 Tax=Thalassotalea algicola TaxID=2716224 RepID=A0A7Y0LAU5_9GAMM|nr:2-oxoacid:acceptor oxidoreductase subunit alpha [Thalassotalea algicola]NMP31140.1 2-oxoacid:acceptor oxidoreductase subunit alpha [Thalassotalea algicola]